MGLCAGGEREAPSPSPLAPHILAIQALGWGTWSHRTGHAGTAPLELAGELPCPPHLRRTEWILSPAFSGKRDQPEEGTGQIALPLSSVRTASPGPSGSAFPRSFSVAGPGPACHAATTETAPPEGKCVAGAPGLRVGSGSERAPGVLDPGIARELPGHRAWSPGPAHLDWSGHWLPEAGLKLDLLPMALGHPLLWTPLKAWVLYWPLDQMSSGREKGVRRCWSLLSPSSLLLGTLTPWLWLHLTEQ